MITLDVSWTAGTDFQQAAIELVALARQLNVIASGRFNEVLLIASPRTTVADIVVEWNKAMDRARAGLPDSSPYSHFRSDT